MGANPGLSRDALEKQPRNKPGDKKGVHKMNPASRRNRTNKTAVTRENSGHGEVEKIVNQTESVQEVLLTIASHAHQVREGIVDIMKSFYKDYFEPERMFGLCMEQDLGKIIELLEKYPDNPVSCNFAARLRAAIEREKSMVEQEALKAKFSSRPSVDAGAAAPAPKKFILLDDGKRRYLFGTGKSLKSVIRTLEKLCPYGTSRQNNRRAADGMDQENSQPSLMQLFELDDSRIVGDGHVKVSSEFMTLIGRQRSALTDALVRCSKETFEAFANGASEQQQLPKNRD